MVLANDKELTEEEFEELERFLEYESGLDLPMTISEIDGLLTAVVIGPVFPPPSQWMPLVWRDEEGPEFETYEQMQRITGLLMQHMNSISSQLRQDADNFEPMLLVGLDEDKKPITIADHWCLGFMAGLSLNADIWQEVEDALLPIYMFATEPGDAELDNELETNKDYWISMLGPAVSAVYKYFLEQRSTGERTDKTVIYTEPKTGRNEPCHCGSGKKYKKCCGLN
ncbi:MAG: UPF0149 family protein [Gammaproteobacteria bacterium]|nr:UPF0149 family protein [Gammaproteobacteria bacterium]